MKKLAQYLQIALLLYFLAFLMFFIFFDMLGSMLAMDPITPESMVKVFLTGIILFLAAWGTLAMNQSSTADKLKKMEAEMNGLKAKLYDLEHPKVTPTSVPKQPVPQKNQEEPTGAIKPRQNFTDQ